MNQKNFTFYKNLKRFSVCEIWLEMIFRRFFVLYKNSWRIDLRRHFHFKHVKIQKNLTSHNFLIEFFQYLLVFFFKFYSRINASSLVGRAHSWTRLNSLNVIKVLERFSWACRGASYSIESVGAWNESEFEYLEMWCNMKV